MRTGDAAKALGVSVDTVRRLIARGQLLAHRYPDDGPTWYLVDRDDLERVVHVARLRRLRPFCIDDDTLRD